jgi:chaperone modulatory protein CbpM
VGAGARRRSQTRDAVVVIALDDLLRRMHGLDRREVVSWVENRWVLAERHGGDWLFRDVDVARVELIQEIRHEFAIDDEAVPLVLDLLDQVYSLRRQLRRLCDAIAAQPEEVRQRVKAALPPPR